MIITDPAFYAAAVPAVLLLGISKSGFGAGFGALAVPLMALAVPVPQAAAILLPVLAIIDGLGLKALWRERDAPLLKLLLPAGLVGSMIGFGLFSLLSARTVAAMVGALTLAFLAIRTVRPPRADAPPPARWLGRVLAAVSGFTSFVAHAGGPPVGFYVLPLKLAPVRFTATMAVYFAAINASKWLPYAWLGLIDGANLGTSLVLAPLAPMGVWIGVRVVRVIPQTLFYRVFNVGLLLTGTKLLWDGLRIG
jgi:hypothetical protein